MHSSAVEVPDRTVTKDSIRRTHSWCAAQLAREAVSALDCALSNDALVGPCRAPEPKSIQPNVDVGALRSSRQLSARASLERFLTVVATSPGPTAAATAAPGDAKTAVATARRRNTTFFEMFFFVLCGLVWIESTLY